MRSLKSWSKESIPLFLRIMKKVVIIGGGIAGMTAGVLLQKAGFKTEIYEKNALP